ncbi:MAG: hypothetical protein ACJ79A_18150 [Gemmatimonadaceae bacterium]
MRDDRTPPFNPFAPGEPPRDEELAGLLRHAVGDVPGTVDWDALATRIARALPARTSVAWWSYAESWSRRILPIALAASLVGAAMLWNADDASAVAVAQAPTDVVADVVQGVPIEDAARTFSRTVTAEGNLIAPESE